MKSRRKIGDALDEVGGQRSLAWWPRLVAQKTVNYADFKAKVKSSMHSLQRNAGKIRSFFQKDTLKYAA